MKKKSLKEDLRALIASCNDEARLQQAKEVLQSGNVDWWDDLSEKDQMLVRESEAEYQSGKFITWEQLQKEIDSKKKK